MIDNESLATEEGYVNFVNGLSAPAESLQFDRATSLLIDQLSALATSGLVLDHLKRNVAYGDKLRINNTPAIRSSTYLHKGVPNYDTKANLAHALLGILTEAIELAPILIDLLKGDEVDLTNLVEELGDGTFYTQMAATAAISHLRDTGWPVRTGSAMQVVRQVNVDKLFDRYKGLAFKADRAISRDVDGEQKVMETSIANK